MQNESVNILSIIALLSLIIYAFFSMTSSLSQTLLYILFPIATVTSFYGATTIELNKYMKIFSLVVAWIFFSSLFSINLDLSFLQLKRLICVYMACLSIYYIAQHDKLVPYVFVIWLVLYAVCINYARTHILIAGYDIASDRVTDDNLNSNLFAYYTFFITVIIYLLHDEVSREWLKLTLSILFLTLFPLSFYIAIITASRQVLVVQIPLLLILSYIRYIKDSSPLITILLLLLVLCVGIFFTNSIIDIYDESLLTKRTEITSEDDRLILSQKAWEIGWENPLVGVGPNCVALAIDDEFSHNTFLELFASSGLIGVCLYIYLLLYYIINQYNKYQSTGDSMFTALLAIGIIYILANMFYVYYLKSWLMAFFIIISSYSDYYYNKHYDNEQT